MEMSGEELNKHLTNYFKRRLIPSIKKEFGDDIDVSIYDINVEEFAHTNFYDIFVDTEPVRIDFETTKFIRHGTDEFLTYLNFGWGQYNVSINKRMFVGHENEKIIKHRGSISEKEELPFNEKISGNVRERTFSENTDEMDLKWHWDEQDRIVTPLHKTDWMLQFDNELPVKLIEGKEYFIPVGVYHRVIKGTGDLQLKVKLL
jgi:hypothetical protein